jgi:flagellar biosynthetic protein FliP
MKRGLFILGILGFLLLGSVEVAAQQLPSLDSIVPPGDATAAGRMVQLALVITVLSVAPGLLIMVTCFTRFVIALSFLRAGIGLQTTPANLILISLALFMTVYVMAPTFDRAWQGGLAPLLENKITEEEAYHRITAPFRSFMLANVRDKDLKLFSDLASESLWPKQNKDAAAAPAPETGDAAVAPAPQAGDGAVTAAPQAGEADVELRVLIPAFMISELRRGFEIGFLMVLPFLVIDMIVATLTMSMGMMMLPPTVISLPFKILFFVLIDGWNLLAGGLIRSFA